jgi:hypothetical protein
MTGTGLSALVYVALCYISPPPGMARRFMEVDESEGEARFGSLSRGSPGLEQEGYGSEKDVERHGRMDKLATQVHVLPA